mgnify:CR=1 FL=1
MAIYTIGDLHLAFKENKPMDIFGENWKNHEKKIKQSLLKAKKKMKEKKNKKKKKEVKNNENS